MSEPRTVHAPRGTQLTCKSWLTEAAYRMIQNNLDPEVAEQPQDLVVYGGRGKAARSWEAFDAILDCLREPGKRRDPAGAVRQTGGGFQNPPGRPARADRQLQPGAALGHPGAFRRPVRPWIDHVRPDDRRLVDLYRHAGHPAGHL